MVFRASRVWRVGHPRWIGMRICSFFFQAEDGIRDYKVTGVQTCALPILEEPEANELAYARLAAQAIGAEHREVIVSPAEFFAELPRLIWHEDEPIAFPSRDRKSVV